MMRALLIGAILALTACGADGPPVPPTKDSTTPPPGISLSGRVEIGVTGSF